MYMYRLMSYKRGEREREKESEIGFICSNFNSCDFSIQENPKIPFYKYIFLYIFINRMYWVGN